MKNKKQVEEFLNPTSPRLFTEKDLGLTKKEVDKALKRIAQAIKKKEGIIVYGDYDADGICSTAIIWETLYRFTKNVLPYIPERVSEGYGLNQDSIAKLKSENPNLKLIITVDQGITANEKIEFAKSLGIEVIVCDHHQIGEKIPDCTAVVHTDKVCAAAIAWFLAKKVSQQARENLKIMEKDLDLVAIATIADLQPLLGINRSLTKHGLKVLNETKRCGLLEIFEEAGLKSGEIGNYEVGFIIAPRLNAMGRMEHALESLRLICTPNKNQARDLAQKLGLTNKERQTLTEEVTKHARQLLLASGGESQKLIFISHETYQEGVIGLAAGKLAEEFYRPAVVVSKGEIYSKASARSVNGFNIIEAIRACSDLLVEVGGHPMAAGFTVETSKLAVLKSRLEELANKELDEQKLTKTLKVDCELPLAAVKRELFEKIAEFAPFGLGNPSPVFVSRKVRLVDFRSVGNSGKHLKFKVAAPDSSLIFEAIAFSWGSLAPKLLPGQEIDIAYGLQINYWEGQEKLELKIKDLKWKKD